MAVHKVDDRYFFEIDNTMLGRDFLLVSRISGVPAGSGGFTSAGSSIDRAHGPLGEARQQHAAEEHQRRCRTPTTRADREVGERRTTSRRFSRRFRSRRSATDNATSVDRRHGLLRRRHPGAVGAVDGAAPHVRRAALRPGAQLRQRRALVSDQRRSAARADVRRHRAAGRSHRRHDQPRDAAVDRPAAEGADAAARTSIRASASSPSIASTTASTNRRRRPRRSSRAGGSSRRIRRPTRAASSSNRSSRSSTTSIRRRRRSGGRYVKEGVEAVAEGVREGRLQERDPREGSADEGRGSRTGIRTTRASRWCAGRRASCATRSDRTPPIRAPARSSTARSPGITTTCAAIATG